MDGQLICRRCLASPQLLCDRRRQRGRAAERAFCRDSFVSQRALEGIADLRQQFKSLLAEAGLLGTRQGSYEYKCEHEKLRAGRSGRGNAKREAGGVRSRAWEEANLHAGNVRLVLAVVSAGLYSNLVRVDPPPGRRLLMWAMLATVINISSG
eukprot:scaffold30872_cov32-Prasinocladus_malaysianus.AAC.3